MIKAILFFIKTWVCYLIGVCILHILSTKFGIFVLRDLFKVINKLTN